MSELKPCPFCGSEQPQDSKDDGNVPYEFGMSRSCNSCSAAVNLDWNSRPIEDALNARIAELEVENAELKERVAMLDVTAVFKSLGEMGYIEQTNKLHARIAELEEAQCWVPVSERLPKESGWYRVGAIDVFYEGYTDEVYFDANKTKLGWHTCSRNVIYCWLDGVPELPKPPEVK